MDLISSDTNVWIDFAAIDKLDLPFKLPVTYLMNTDAISNELLEPKGLGEKLVRLGLQPVEMTEDEFFYVEKILSKYNRLSTYDGIALSIAKFRHIPLLTGDKALRKAAKEEDVDVIGTIGIFDRLFEKEFISKAEYIQNLIDLLKLNGTIIRLPEKALKERINRFS